MRTEIEFLRDIRNYCGEMRMKVGKSILDDFARLIDGRMRDLKNKEEEG